MSDPLVGVIMGSDSDLRVMEEAATILAAFEVPHEVTIVSAHRTPQRLYEYAREAEPRGMQAIIAGAGGAAHLPGMVAAITTLPVIGVPINATVLSGEDALLSIVQMPAGVPVATVAIDNATNAGLLAVQILAAGNAGLRKQLQEYKDALRDKVVAKAQTLTEKRPQSGKISC
jgi:5-(carboxyamino)imidazole ribonucleotide mutase